MAGSPTYMAISTSRQQVVHSLSTGQEPVGTVVGGRPAIGPPVVIPGLVTTVSMNAPETGVAGLWYW